MNEEVLSHDDRSRRSLILAACFVGAMVPGCASGPKPVNVKLTIEAGRDINPDARGRPSPVALKLFELKSLASFERADFFSLFDRERETLGPELVAREQMVLMPGDRVTQERTVAPDVRFIGVLVGFRDLERAQWRLSVPIEAARGKPLVIQLDAARVTLKGT